MATAYLQIFPGAVPSTQDLARSEFEDLPVAVIAPAQSAGRGRSGANWENADSAVAVSVAWKLNESDLRPFSLMAGVAAIRSIDVPADLKWPNDVVAGGAKVGGILVEVSGGVAIAGLGLNLFWDDPPVGVGALYDKAPPADRYKEIGALWVAELMGLVDGDGWPADEYRSACRTIGREITWEPDGSGKVLDVDDEGGLVVETSGGTERIHSGAVRHIR